MNATPSAPTRANSLEANRFEAYLRSKKLKLTGERMEILGTIFQKGSHFDAEELHADLKRLGRDISRATVYRTLDLLVQCGLVRKSSLGSTHANYEAAHENEHHDHLICLNCNKVFEFFRPDLETLQEAICKEQKFRPVHHSLQIFGVCVDCTGKTDENQLRAKVAQIHT